MPTIERIASEEVHEAKGSLDEFVNSLKELGKKLRESKSLFKDLPEELEKLEERLQKVIDGLDLEYLLERVEYAEKEKDEAGERAESTENLLAILPEALQMLIEDTTDLELRDTLLRALRNFSELPREENISGLAPIGLLARIRG